MLVAQHRRHQENLHTHARGFVRDEHHHLHHHRCRRRSEVEMCVVVKSRKNLCVGEISKPDILHRLVCVLVVCSYMWWWCAGGSIQKSYASAITHTQFDHHHHHIQLSAHPPKENTATHTMKSTKKKIGAQLGAFLNMCASNVSQTNDSRRRRRGVACRRLVATIAVCLI